MQMTIETPGDGTYSRLHAELVRLNKENSPWTGHPFTVAAKDASGTLIGGVRGIVNLGLVDIRGLWVDPTQRNAGHGASLMKELERHAASLGASRAALFTYDWQARGFYEKLGYSVFGTLSLPAGATRYHMQKELDGPA